RAGVPVVRRGWPGITTPPQQVFDSAYLVLDTPLDEVERHSLQVRYGFAESTLVPVQEFARTTGVIPEEAGQIVLFANKNRPVRAEQLKDLLGQLGDRRARMLPLVDRLLVTPAGTDLELSVRTADPRQFKMPSLVHGSVDSWEPWRTNASYIQAEGI